MKHGTVRNGTKITMYGNDANNWMARRMAENAYTHDDAIELIKRTCGSMREAIIANLDGKYLLTEKNNANSREKFEVTPKLKKELEELDIQRAVAAKERRFQENKKLLRSKAHQEARSNLSIPCLVCKKPITAGQKYRKYKRLRAHKACV